MNRVFLIGNLTRDPEITETTSGIKVCRFGIAVNRSYTNAAGERKTDFFNVVAWRGLGETVAKYMHKGSKICVSGSIETREYDPGDGNKRTYVDIVASDVEFLTPKGGSAASDDSSEDRGPKLQPFDDGDDDDMPF